MDGSTFFAVVLSADEPAAFLTPMAIVNVVRYENNRRQIVGKYAENDIRLGSQLIVYPSQTAFFVRGGVILDEFTSGTYTINSDNIPLLNKIINLPFGSESPFGAEVWFVNQTSMLDCKWGTATPLQVEDPKYGVIVPVKAFGQYGFRVSSPRRFIEAFVGNMPSFETEILGDYFRGIIQSRLSTIVNNALLEANASVVNIASKTAELSEIAQTQLQPIFEEYGVELLVFTVISVTVAVDDPSFQRLKEAIDAKAEMRIIGNDNYQIRRSFDVLEAAASNTGSGTMGAAVGLGAGINLGAQMAGMAGTYIQPQASTMPPLPPVQYYVVVGGTQQGPYNLATLQAFMQQGQLDGNTLVWKAGMPQWAAASTLPELSIPSTPPPVPNNPSNQ